MRDLRLYLLQFLEDEVIAGAMPYLRQRVKAQQCINIPLSLKQLIITYLYNYTIATLNSITGLADTLAQDSIEISKLEEHFGTNIKANINRLFTPAEQIKLLD